MASHLEGQDAFKARALLSEDELYMLIDKGVTILSMSVFLVTAPSAAPDVTQLRDLLNTVHPENVTIGSCHQSDTFPTPHV